MQQSHVASHERIKDNYVKQIKLIVASKAALVPDEEVWKETLTANI